MNLMNAMMLSCVKATEFMEQKELMPLSLMQKVQLRMHIAMCSGCRNYVRQTVLINKLLDRTFNSAVVADSSDLEKRIIAKIS